MPAAPNSYIKDNTLSQSFIVIGRIFDKYHIHKRLHFVSVTYNGREDI